MPKALRRSDFFASAIELLSFTNHLPSPPLLPPIAPLKTPPTPFPFFSLPLELRNLVYTHLLGPCTPSSLFHTSASYYPYITSLIASHTQFPTTLFYLSRAFTAEFSTILYFHLTLTLHVPAHALAPYTMRKFLQTKRLRKLRICLNMATMVDSTDPAWDRGSGALRGRVLPVEETVFALAARVNEMMGLEEVGIEIEAPDEEEEQVNGYWVRYWDGSDVRREPWEVRSALVRGLRVHGKRVHVSGMCEGCREALQGELDVEVETFGAVEVPVWGSGGEVGRGRRMLARDTTPIWVDGGRKREGGGWV